MTPNLSLEPFFPLKCTIHSQRKKKLRKQPLVFGPSRLPLRGSLYKTSSIHRQVMPQPLRQCGPSVTGWNSQGCGAGCLAALTSGNTSALPIRSPAVSLGTSTQATALHRTHHYMPFFQSQEPLLHLGNSLFQPSPLLFHPRTTQLSSLLKEKSLDEVGQQVSSPGSTKAITNPWEKSETQTFLERLVGAKLPFHLYASLF